jgi:hypothetical protein
MFYIDKRVLAFFQDYTDLVYHKYGLSKSILVTVMMALYFIINIYLYFFLEKIIIMEFFLWQPS